jgi:hypothetical protein
VITYNIVHSTEEMKGNVPRVQYQCILVAEVRFLNVSFTVDVRGFSFVTLPVTLHNLTDMTIFKKNLKTHLFQKYLESYFQLKDQ